MKKYLILVLIVIPFRLWAQDETCLEPDKLELLDANLEAELALLGEPMGFEQTPSYKNLRSKKYNRILKIVEKEFPQNYKDIFYHYADNFKKLDQLYQQAITDENRERITTIRPVWETNRYIFSDVFPTLLADRALIEFRILSPPDLVTKKTSEFWKEMPQKEFSYRNLKICKAAELNLNLKKSSYELDQKLLNVPYKWSLRTPFPKSFSGDFDSEYGASVRDESLDGNPDFISDPDSNNLDKELSGEIKSVWVWIKNTFDFLDYKKYRTREGEVSKIRDYTEEGRLNRNLDFLENRNRNLNIKRRYMNWRNNRNYWITKTKDVSGYNTDILVEKFEIMLDGILRTNAELEDSLEAIEKICQRQNIPVGCWNGSNTLPIHARTIGKSYEYRSSQARD